MKNMIPIVLSTLVVSTSALAQAPADPIATALSALPANLREAATVAFRRLAAYNNDCRGSVFLECSRWPARWVRRRPSANTS